MLLWGRSWRLKAQEGRLGTALGRQHHLTHGRSYSPSTASPCTASPPNLWKNLPHFFFKDLSIYIWKLVTKREKSLFHLLVHFRSCTMARAAPFWSQDPGVPSRTSTWAGKALPPGPLYTVLPRPLADSCLNGAVKTQNGAQHHTHLTHYATMPATSIQSWLFPFL